MSFSAERETTGSELPVRLEELNAKDMEQARRLAQDPGYQPDSQLLLQAENMAKIARIELRPEEARLYCALRQQESTAMGGRIAAESETGTRAADPTDQKILAAVLREFGDKERLRKFAGRHPNIFP